MLAFFFEEQVDDVGGADDAELARVELFGLAQNFPQDFIAHGARGFHLTQPAAGGAGLQQHVRQRVAGAFAGEFHQAELREAADGDLHLVARQRFTQFVEHGGAVLGVVHVDEVDDDDAAQIAQPQLAGDGLRGLQIGAVDGVVEVARADETAGVDVDGGHRLGLVDDEVAAGFEVDSPPQRALDFLVHVRRLEQRALAAVELQAAADPGHVFGGEALKQLEVFARVDLHAAGGVAHQIA